MYGVKSVAPIVLPPQGCALGLGAITVTVIPAEGEQPWTVRDSTTAAYVCDVFAGRAHAQRHVVL